MVYAECGGLHVFPSVWFYRVPVTPFGRERKAFPVTPIYLGDSDKINMLHLFLNASWRPGSTLTAPPDRDNPVHELFQQVAIRAPGWGFHTVWCGIDRVDYRIRPWLVRVVHVWKDS